MFCTFSSTAASGFSGNAVALPASAPRNTAPARNPANGKFDLLVCYTTPEKGEQLATWLNENPASPLAGHLELQATNKRGSVRIKGFASRDEGIRKKVHETRDPTGGSGTFSDAQWRNAK